MPCSSLLVEKQHDVCHCEAKSHVLEHKPNYWVNLCLFATCFPAFFDLMLSLDQVISANQRIMMIMIHEKALLNLTTYPFIRPRKAKLIEPGALTTKQNSLITISKHLI